MLCFVARSPKLHREAMMVFFSKTWSTRLNKTHELDLLLVHSITDRNVSNFISIYGLGVYV